MRGVRIPHDLNGEDRFVLGLSVTRLAALLLGLLAAYTILHLSLPAPLQLGAAAVAALTGAAIAWVRPEGRSLIHWALAAIEFKFGQQIAPDPDNRPINDRAPRLSVVAVHTRSAPGDQLRPATPAQLGRAERFARELIDLGSSVDPEPWFGTRPFLADIAQRGTARGMGISR